MISDGRTKAIRTSKTSTSFVGPQVQEGAVDNYRLSCVYSGKRCENLGLRIVIMARYPVFGPRGTHIELKNVPILFKRPRFLVRCSRPY